MLSPTVELQLIQQASAGDRLALEQLLTAYYDRIATHIRRSIPATLQRAVGAEDIVQESFISAFRDIKRFQPKSQMAFFRWLTKIADHRLLDAIRSQKRQKRGGGQAGSAVRATDAGSSFDWIQRVVGNNATGSSLAARKEALAAQQVALARLPDEYREVLLMRYIEEQTLDEIADVLGRTKDAVRSLLYRAKKELRTGMDRSSLWWSK